MKVGKDGVYHVCSANVLFYEEVVYTVKMMKTSVWRGGTAY